MPNNFSEPIVTLAEFNSTIYNTDTQLISQLYAGPEGFWFQRPPLEKVATELMPDAKLIVSSDFIRDPGVPENNALVTVTQLSPNDGGSTTKTYRAGMFFAVGDEKIAVLLPKGSKGIQRAVVAFSSRQRPSQGALDFLHKLAEKIKIETPNIKKFRSNLQPRS